MNIRAYTRLIIRKDGEYLVGCQVGTHHLVWSISPWDAWSTRRREDAERVISRVGGELILFNPIAGQIRKYVYKEE